MIINLGKLWIFHDATLNNIGKEDFLKIKIRAES